MRATKAILMAAAGAVAATAFGGVASAQTQPKRPTPPGWHYEIRDGKRVPRANNRVTKPDGSWREEVRQGKCVTIKERSASGEYKETRQCDGK
jgi:Spy/CpxP family protein refolding chaperone